MFVICLIGSNQAHRLQEQLDRGILGVQFGSEQTNWWRLVGDPSVTQPDRMTSGKNLRYTETLSVGYLTLTSRARFDSKDTSGRVNGSKLRKRRNECDRNSLAVTCS